MSELDNILKEFNNKFAQIKSQEELQTLKSELFGKSGLVTSQFKKMNSLKEEEKKIFAKNLNILKNELSIKIENKLLTKPSCAGNITNGIAVAKEIPRITRVILRIC